LINNVGAFILYRFLQASLQRNKSPYYPLIFKLQGYTLTYFITYIGIKLLKKIKPLKNS